MYNCVGCDQGGQVFSEYRCNVAFERLRLSVERRTANFVAPVPAQDFFSCEVFRKLLLDQQGSIFFLLCFFQRFRFRCEPSVEQARSLTLAEPKPIF